MSVYFLGPEPIFPPAELAESEGLLAVGGDLSVPRLLEAYRCGIFPWYDEPPILWWSPDPRLILRPDDLRISRSLRATIRKGRYEVRFDTDFLSVIRACSQIKRKHEDGTWINEEIIHAYHELHRLGFAHSVETWEGDELVGGLYGVYLGRAFFGESMFARKTDASKVALVALVDELKRREVELIDCQVTTEHLLSLGAVEVPRSEFLDLVERLTAFPDERGPWSSDDTEPAEQSGLEPGSENRQT